MAIPINHSTACLSSIPARYSAAQGPAPTNPGCDPNSPPPSDCVFDTNNPVTSYHLITQCIENPSPSWNESSRGLGLQRPGRSAGPRIEWIRLGCWARRQGDVPPFNDVGWIRAMGYYDGSDLNYYYFMASNFATSDRWFNPALTRTQPNRAYLIAATSQGYAYPMDTDAEDTSAGDGTNNLSGTPSRGRQLEDLRGPCGKRLVPARPTILPACSP